MTAVFFKVKYLNDLWTISGFTISIPPIKDQTFKVLKRLVQNSLISQWILKILQERQKHLIRTLFILERKFTRIFFVYAITLYFFVKCSDDV